MLIKPANFAVETPLTPRLGVIAAVLLLHLAALATWAVHPHARNEPHEMSISMTMPASVAAAPAEPEPVLPQPVKAAAITPVAVKPTATPTAPASPPAVANTPAAPTAPAAPSAPVLPDREPDFSAAYLNNPKPRYPNVAEKMHWQGKVIVRVEVLMSGVAGEVSLYQSSGHEVLDNAALAAVKKWRFTPARVAGQPITKTFLVPIPFKWEADTE